MNMSSPVIAVRTHSDFSRKKSLVVSRSKNNSTFNENQTLCAVLKPIRRIVITAGTCHVVTFKLPYYAVSR